MDKKVFVTYSWGNTNENSRVYRLVNYLRECGINTECDIMKIQSQTSINFHQMMSDALQYPKVIVVLSEHYKQKADAFQGGVGIEYNMISGDISKESNKYILVTFNSDFINITPNLFKNRAIIDLSKGKPAFEKLISLLLDTPQYNFSPVSEKKIDISQINVGSFSFEKKNTIEEKEYITQAKLLCSELGIDIATTSHSEMNGTNLYTNIEELEDGRVIAFPCNNYDIIDNNIWYYYNVKNRVIYSLINNEFSKITK